jgi:hypothetical protein
MDRWGGCTPRRVGESGGSLRGFEAHELPVDSDDASGLTVQRGGIEKGTSVVCGWIYVESTRTSWITGRAGTRQRHSAQYLYHRCYRSHTPCVRDISHLYYFPCPSHIGALLEVVQKNASLPEALLNISTVSILNNRGQHQPNPNHRMEIFEGGHTPTSRVRKPVFK